VKVPQADSVEPEADVAVTKPVRTAVLLCSMAALLVGYQNCAVTLSGETPGASTFNCSPDTATLSDFAALETSILQSTTYANHCGNCHVQSSGTGYGQYPILANSTPSSSSPITLANYCSMSSRGTAKMSVIFSNGHGGGNFSSDLSRQEFSDLQTFFNDSL